MTSGSFDFAPLFPAGLPAPAAKWKGFPRYNFIGGNNDAEQVPVDRLIAAAPCHGLTVQASRDMSSESGR